MGITLLINSDIVGVVIIHNQCKKTGCFFCYQPAVDEAGEVRFFSSYWILEAVGSCWKKKCRCDRCVHQNFHLSHDKCCRTTQQHLRRCLMICIYIYTYIYICLWTYIHGAGDKNGLCLVSKCTRLCPHCFFSYCMFIISNVK